jgi:acetone carboxylase gamma subunit
MSQTERERITEYLDLDLEREQWVCNRCETALADARKSYKTGLLVHERDPREIHRPLIDEKQYAYTFAPDPSWCRILEYYCPQCGTQVETEYLVPGHPITHDIELDLGWFKARAARRKEVRP